jgi:hypothetical protein
LGSRQDSDWYSEWRARNFGQANGLAELDGVRVTTVLTADTNVKTWVNFSGFFDAHFHELANTISIDGLEGISFIDTFIDKELEESSGIISGDTQSELGQIVGTEGQEIDLWSDLLGGDAHSWDFDHGSNFVVDILRELVSSINDDFLDHGVLFEVTGEWDLDPWLGTWNVLSGSHDGSGLHLHDAWVFKTDSASSESAHWVELVEGSNDLGESLGSDATFLSDFSDFSLTSWKELMERWVKISNDNWFSINLVEDFLEIFLLEWFELKSLKSLRNVASLPRDSPRSLLPSTSSTQCADSEDAESVLNTQASCKCKPEPS